ncbi:hypothetical protein I5535_13725 [Rhodobacteraceae bacterium F11138]|nr:hypothetical protein [Rhodobacteraceae bacterium F11138]
MLSPDFARSGLHVQPTAWTPTRFQVLGERSSGTNLATRLLARNTGLRPSDVLGWKHGFPSSLAIPQDLAVICVVRNAVDWARSMHAKPWHTTPDMQTLDFAAFLRAPWQTVIDRPRYFNKSNGLVGQPLQQDRDPVAGTVFVNLFALRQAKLTGLLSYLNRGCTCAVLRLETLQHAPQATIEQLTRSLTLPDRDSDFRPVVKRLGSRFKPAIPSRPATPADFSPEDMAFLRAQIDPDQEAALGYGY